MVSFTGSTRAGTEVARNAAASVKRVHQELGGKSPNMLLDDADFERAVKQERAARVPELRPVLQCADAHAGAGRQSSAEVEAIAKRVADGVVVGDPRIGKDRPSGRWSRSCSSSASRATSRRASPKGRSS